MTPTQERWAEALQVEKMHGEQAMNFAAERIGSLLEQGDADGVERWREIYGLLGKLGEGARRQ